MKWPHLEGEYEQTPFVIENENFGWESEQMLFFTEIVQKFFRKYFYFIEIMDRIKRLVTDWQRTVLEQLLRAISEIVSLARNADSLAS